jgi:hypothetical protein
LFITCNLKVLRSGSKLESSISESTAEWNWTLYMICLVIRLANIYILL